jgi:3'DNA-binding domain (3'BD)
MRTGVSSYVPSLFRPASGWGRRASGPPPMLGAMGAIAKVEPLTTARALRGPFDYRIPREMAGVRVGSVLVVPFGRRRIHGLVVDVVATSELPPERLVEPLECL